MRDDTKNPKHEWQAVSAATDDELCKALRECETDGLEIFSVFSSGGEKGVFWVVARKPR